MKPTYLTTMDIPDVAAVLATLPADPERDRLAGDYRAACARYRAHLRRKDELTDRLHTVSMQIVDATGQGRKTLLAEHGTLTAELGTAPATAVVLAERYAEALLAWSRYVWRQLRTLRDACNDRMTVQSSEWGFHARQVVRLNVTMFDAQRRPHEEELAAINAERAPLDQERRALHAAMSAIEVRVHVVIGSNGAYLDVSPEEMARFLDRARRMAA